MNQKERQSETEAKRRRSRNPDGAGNFSRQKPGQKNHRKGQSAEVEDSLDDNFGAVGREKETQRGKRNRSVMNQKQWSAVRQERREKSRQNQKHNTCRSKEREFVSSKAGESLPRG
jgi:hypothetical protein